MISDLSKPSRGNPEVSAAHLGILRSAVSMQISDAGEGKGLHKYLSRIPDIAIGRACCVVAVGSIQDAKLPGNETWGLHIYA